MCAFFVIAAGVILQISDKSKTKAQETSSLLVCDLCNGNVLNPLIKLCQLEKDYRMATTGSSDGDAIMKYGISNINLYPVYFVDVVDVVVVVVVGVFLPMPEEELHQQNHSTGTEAESFAIVLQGGFLKTHLLRRISLRDPAPV